MSTLKVDSITDSAGTGAPDFPNGLTGDLSGATGYPLATASTPGLVADPANLSGGIATMLGLKVYEEGTAYTNGTPTISASTNVTSLGTKGVARFIPSKDSDGNWWMEMFIRYTGMATVSSVDHAISISGITFRSGTNTNALLTGSTESSGGGPVIYCISVQGSTGIIIRTETAATPTIIAIQGKAPLASKPTWAD